MSSIDAYRVARRMIPSPVPRSEPFESHPDRYDGWFARNESAYVSEMLAVRALLPVTGRCLEIGVGSGRFAAPLGIQYGVDPSTQMLKRARSRGVAVVVGVAEALPFANSTFAAAVIVTTICFVDDPQAMMREARRVLQPNGVLLIGFIDRTSSLGQQYLERRTENVFYRDARFYSPSEVAELVRDAGFRSPTWLQTLAGTLGHSREVEKAEPGFGRGAFVVAHTINASH